MTGELYWSGMKADVRKYVESWETCQRNKIESLKPARLLQPLPIPYQVWEELTMDFIEGLPKLVGYDSIMVVVD